MRFNIVDAKILTSTLSCHSGVRSNSCITLAKRLQSQIPIKCAFDFTFLETLFADLELRNQYFESFSSMSKAFALLSVD